MLATQIWWTGEDSNLRTSIDGQIYSLLPLTTRPPVRTRSHFNLWSGRRESNPRPTAWKAVTLPLSYSRPLLGPSHEARVPSQSFFPLGPRAFSLGPVFLEPMTGIEPVTSSLPRTRSTN